MRTNDIQKVIVLNSTTTAVTTAITLDAAPNNSIGFYDPKTLTAITAANIASGTKDFVVLYKESADKVIRSGGQSIQRSKIKKVSSTAYTPGVNQQIKVAGFTLNCGESYGVSIETRNPQIYRTQGYVQFKKSFVATLPACTGTSTYGNDVAIAKDLIIQINNNSDGLFSAKAVARTAFVLATHGFDAAIGADIPGANLAAQLANLDLAIAYNANSANATKTSVDIVITALPLPANDFQDIPLTYYHPRQNMCVVAKVGNLNSTGTITTTVQPTVEIGSGLEIKYAEAMASGYSNGYNRTSTLTGTALPQGLKAVATTTYKQYGLTCDFTTVESGTPYESTISTLIAIPTGGTAIASLDTYFTNIATIAVD